MRACVAFLLCCSLASADTPKPRPNVLLIVIDTLRADRIAATRNGVPVMPKLHAFAERSWWFENAFSQASWTKPSVVSILTSLYPATHRVQFGIPANWFKDQDRSRVEGLPAEKQTAPHFFKQHGYATAAVQTNGHLQPQYGFAQGCDAYNPAYWSSGTQVTDFGLADAARLEPPFFLYAHYFDPHAPYGAPEPHYSAFGPVPGFSAEDTAWIEDAEHFKPYYMDKIMHDMGKKPARAYSDLSEQGRERLRTLYDGDCHYADAEVTRLIEGVRELRPDTIVVITADHGEEFWEHGSIGHAKTVYQEVINVPLIVSIPGLPALKIKAPVETIDILPTLAEAAVVPANPAWQGRSLLSPQLRARPVYCETNGSLPETGLDKWTIIDGPFKLIRDHARDVELYDLSADPREQRNLLAEAADRAAALGKTMDQHFADALAHPAAKIPPTVNALDDDTKEQLKSLGYIGGEK